MKKSTLVLLALAAQFSAFSQFVKSETTTTTSETKVKQREAGVTFQNFNGFGLTYRFGTNKALWRLNGFTMFGGSYAPYYYSGKSGGQDPIVKTLALSFGREWRKPLSEKVSFRLGADLNLGYSNVSITNPNNVNLDKIDLQSGLNMVLGFNYKLNDYLLVGAEMNPGLDYHAVGSVGKEADFFGDPNKGNNSYVDYSIFNTAKISLVAKF